MNPEAQGNVYIPLKKPCPRCQGVLEREDKARIQNARPAVRCSGCQTQWEDYAHVLAEARVAAREQSGLPKGFGIQGLRTHLQKLKIGVRAGRNVASSARAVSNIVSRMAGEVQQFADPEVSNQEVVGKLFEDLEGIVDQVSLTVDHIDEAAER